MGNAFSMGMSWFTSWCQALSAAVHGSKYVEWSPTDIHRFDVWLDVEPGKTLDGKFIPPLEPCIFLGGQRILRNMSADHLKYPTHPRGCFWAAKRGGGGPPDVRLWQWNFWGASRAVKYHGFTPPRLKKKLKQSLGREKTWKCTLQLVCTYHHVPDRPHTPVHADAWLTALRFSFALFSRI